MALDFNALRNASSALNSRLFNLFNTRLFKGQAGTIDKMAAPYRVTAVIEQIKTTTNESGTITRDYQADDAIWSSDVPTEVTHLVLQNVPTTQMQLAVGQQVSLKYTLILKQPLNRTIPTQLTVNGVAVNILWSDQMPVETDGTGITDIVDFRIIVQRTGTSTYGFAAYAALKSYTE